MNLPLAFMNCKPVLAYAARFEPYAARTRHPYAAKINCVELITYII